MRKLMRASQILLPKLEVADTLWSRNRGLLGRADLPADQALLILNCNNIHTFFMRFAIDLIFLNRDMEVTKTVSRVKPGRIVLSMLRSRHVIELSEGFLEKNPVRVGEKLHVDPALS